MKKINEVSIAVGSDNEQQPSRVQPPIKMFVDRLFLQFESIYATTFKSTYPNDEKINASKAEFVKGFYENGICSVDLIKRGLKEARASQSPFIPSVGQFIGWCKKIDYSASEAVLAECMEFRKNRGMVGAKSTEISAAANYMLSHFDWFAFNQVKESEGRRAFTERFLKMLDDDKDILNKPKIMMIEDKKQSFVRYEDRKKNEIKSRLQKLKSMVR